MTVHALNAPAGIRANGAKKTNVVAAAFGRFTAFLKRRKEQRDARAAFNTMLYLEDRILRDIGVSRADVEWASKLPIEENAAEEVRKLSKRTQVLFL